MYDSYKLWEYYDKRRALFCPSRTFLIQYGCSFIPSDAAWRVPLGVQMVPTAAVFCVMWFLPESPRWLLSKGRGDDALQVLENADVKADYEEIKAKFEWEQTVKKPSYIALLFSRRYARRTYIGMGAQFWQQAVGINRYYPIVQGCYTSIELDLHLMCSSTAFSTTLLSSSNKPALALRPPPSLPMSYKGLS